MKNNMVNHGQLYKDYFTRQLGNNKPKYFHGSMRQYGYGFLGNLVRTAIPLISDVMINNNKIDSNKKTKKVISSVSKKKEKSKKVSNQSGLDSTIIKIKNNKKRRPLGTPIKRKKYKHSDIF